MGFVRIEAYDIDQGYVPGDSVAFKILDLDGVKYLLGVDDPGRTKGYRIISEGEETAVATLITDLELLASLEEQYWTQVEEDDRSIPD